MPLLKGCILLDEAIKEACAKLPSEYRIQVDQIDLREDDLRDKIQRAGLLASRYEYLATLERQKATPDLTRASHLSRSAGRYMEIEQRLQEKLQKLLAFNSSSVYIFAHIQPLLAAVQQGLKQVRYSWNSATKEFTLPSKSDMAWVDKIEGDWRQSQYRIQELILKAEQGLGLTDEEFQTLGNYLNSHPNSEIYDRGIKIVAENSGEFDISKIANWAGWTFTGDLAFKEAIASYKKIKNGTFWRSSVKSTKTGFKTWKQVSGDVSRFKIVQKAKKVDEVVNGTGKFVKCTGAKGFVKSLGAIGTVSVALDGFSAYSESKVRGESTAGALLDATIHSGASVTGAYLGAVVGSAIPIPVVGTLVGAWVGSMIGEAISTVYDATTNGKKIDSDTGWAIVNPFD